jgi:hypothetical protein
VGEEIEHLRHDVRFLQRLLAASRERVQETGNPDGHESIFIQAYADVLEERLGRLRKLEAERGSGGGSA